jgi:hypothetical protein
LPSSPSRPPITTYTTHTQTPTHYNHYHHQQQQQQQQNPSSSLRVSKNNRAFHHPILATSSVPTTPLKHQNGPNNLRVLRNQNFQVQAAQTTTTTPTPQQPVLRMLKQKANSITNSVTACGGGGMSPNNFMEMIEETTVTNKSSCSQQPPKESILNRLFSRSRSKDKLGTARYADAQTFDDATAAGNFTQLLRSSNDLQALNLNNDTNGGFLQFKHQAKMY